MGKKVQREKRFPVLRTLNLAEAPNAKLEELALMKGLSWADAARDAIDRGLPLAIQAQREERRKHLPDHC